jgi:protein-disulfide isomerase
MQTVIQSRPKRPLGNRSLVSVAVAVAVLATAACTKEGAAKSEPVQTSAANDSGTAVLATVSDQKITMSDIRDRSGEQLAQLETQYQVMRSKIISTALDSILREKTLTEEAKKSGKSVDEMIAAEAGANGFEPSDAEITAWYKDNPSRVGNKPLDQLRSQIADLLRSDKRKAAEQKLQDRVNAERKVTVAYQPYRLHFENGKAPTLGKADAPVTLVEFSDFQCPFCRAAAPALRQVENKFGDKVQIVYRQFPIPSLHPNAFKAAEASLCANEQGKFWELHDAMFEDQNKLAVSDLKQTARKLGMDGKKFDACLDSGRYVEQVQNDQRDGQRVGVKGTPAMFINGVIVDGGSVPFSVLEAKLQKELQRNKS